MSVADLFATQTAFNQRRLYQDTPESNQAWKTAFDIANNFGNTAETFRKHDENMATSAYRVGAMNAENKQKIDLSPWQTQASIAKAQYDTQTLPARAAYDISRYGDWTVNENARREAQAAQYAWNTTNANAQSANTQAGLDLANWVGQNKVDPLTGVVRTDMEMLTLAQQQGLDVNNPLVFAQLVNPAQKFAQNSANTIAAYNPAYASQTRVAAGLADTMLDDKGQIINATNGNVIGQAPQEALAYYATGTQPQEKKINQSDSVFERSVSSDFYKAIQAAKDANEGVLTREMFDKIARDFSGIYANKPFVSNMIAGTAAQYGFGSQMDTQTTPSAQAGASGIYSASTPTGTTQTQGKTAQQVANEMAGSAPQIPENSKKTINGIVMNGRFVPTNGEQKNISDLFKWLELDEARERGKHW